MKALLTTIALAAALAAAAAPARADDYSFKRTLDRTVPLAGASALGVSGFNGNVHLYADGAGTTVRIHAVLGARSEDALRALDVQTSRDGNTLRVADVCPASRQLLFWSFRDCNIELDVHYPRSLPLSVHSENGNITIDGAGSAVSIANGNGNVRVNGAGGAISVKNGNGNIDIAGAPANVSASNHNGNVTATLSDSWRGAAIAMSTNAGNVELSVPRTFTGKLIARTRMGEVKNRAQFGDGPATVTATTTFGNVVIDRQ